MQRILVLIVSLVIALSSPCFAYMMPITEGTYYDFSGERHSIRGYVDIRSDIVLTGTYMDADIHIIGNLTGFETILQSAWLTYYSDHYAIINMVGFWQSIEYVGPDLLAFETLGGGSADSLGRHYGTYGSALFNASYHDDSDPDAYQAWGLDYNLFHAEILQGIGQFTENRFLDITASKVPELSSLLLFGFGAVMLTLCRMRRGPTKT